ncbi:MAG: hypothetical protein ABIB55_00940, partial [Candidatus Nealsonbacteria bacterium]
IREQGPSGPNVGLVRKNIDCAPCSLVFSGIRYCKKGHLRCVKEITPKEVFDVCLPLLKI